MGGAFDAKMLQQQQQEQQQQAAQNAQAYNPDGSGKANDYHPPHPPQSTFPPLGPPAGGGKTLVVDRAGLAKIASQMATDLAMLRQTLSTLQSEGAGAGMIGGWPTAESFGVNAGNAYAGISEFYNALNAAYDQVIGNLHTTVNNYADAEDATATAARRVGPDSGSANLA
jgi:hypothetical protein